MKLGLGARKSPFDNRDIYLSRAFPISTFPSSYFVDISKLPVWHQRKIGACVGHALAKYQQKLQLEDTKEVKPLSARFLYAVAKCQDGVDGEGTYPRLVAKILKDTGCSTETTVPNESFLDHESYVYDRNINNIPVQSFEEAKNNKIKSYAFVDITRDGLKNAVVNSNGCALLMRVGEEWWTPSWTNCLPLRAPKKVISGHEVYLYGYEDVGDDTKFYIRNSWSGAWGDNGNGYFMWSEYKNHIDEGITFIDLPDKLIEEAQNTKFIFTEDMYYGQRSESIKQLQKRLGVIQTGYYGELTRKAVLEYQISKGFLSWYERYVLRGTRCGSKTRQSLNQT